MRQSREYCCAMPGRRGFEERHIEVLVSISRGRGFYRSVSVRSDEKMVAAGAYMEARWTRDAHNRYSCAARSRGKRVYSII